MAQDFAAEKGRVVVALPAVGLRGPAFMFLTLLLLEMMVVGGLTAVLFSSLEHRPDKAATILAYAMAGFGVAASIALMAATLQYAFRRIEFVVQQGELLVRVLGPLRRTERRWARDEVRGVAVEEIVSATDGKKSDRLKLHLQSKALTFLEGRPRAALEKIAATLNTALAAGAPATSGLLARFPPPASSRIHLNEDGETVSFFVPAMGLRSPAGVGLACGLGYLVVYVGIVAMVLMTGMELRSSGKMISLTLYAAVSLVGAVASFHYVRRRCALVLTPEALVYRMTSPLRSRERVWPREDIKRIVVAGYPTEKLPVYQIEVELLSLAKREVLLDKRDRAELEWLVAVIGNKWMPPEGEAPLAPADD